MQHIARLLIALVVSIALVFSVAVLVITDNALHVPGRPRSRPAVAKMIASETGATWEHVQVTTPEGVTLSAWLFSPREPKGSLVLLLHGVADSRLGMTNHARFLLLNGYTVLIPDSRGHGESGGDLITYGVREGADVRCWTDWAFRKQRIQRLYGIGASMGAAILLESLPREPRFRAVAAECAFSSFEEISYDRMGQVSGLPRWALWPVVRSGFLYALLRYDVDLRQASPINALRATTVPTLLIHGIADANIPLSHSQKLQLANPTATKLWAVPNAGHVASHTVNPAEYSRAIVEWFETHQ